MTKRGLLLVLLAGMLVAPQARADRLPFHLEVGGGPAWLAPSGAGSNNAGMDAFVGVSAPMRRWLSFGIHVDDYAFSPPTMVLDPAEYPGVSESQAGTRGYSVGVVTTLRPDTPSSLVPLVPLLPFVSLESGLGTIQYGDQHHTYVWNGTSRSFTDPGQSYSGLCAAFALGLESHLGRSGPLLQFQLRWAQVALNGGSLTVTPRLLVRF